MQNSIGEIIYVGKSVNLRDRLASYFHSKQSRDKVGRLGKEINGIEVILTNNENESLVLENNLIKYYKPKFNRVLKRDPPCSLTSK